MSFQLTMRLWINNRNILHTKMRFLRNFTDWLCLLSLNMEKLQIFEKFKTIYVKFLPYFESSGSIFKLWHSACNWKGFCYVFSTTSPPASVRYPFQAWRGEAQQMLKGKLGNICMDFGGFSGELTWTVEQIGENWRRTLKAEIFSLFHDVFLV